MRTLTLMVATLVANTALAADFCVGNGDQLQAALTAAANNDEANHVRLRNGIYFRTVVGEPGTKTVFSFQTDRQGSLVMSGGWNANCTQRTLNPLASVLFGQNVQRVLTMRTFGQSTASIVLYNLALAGGFSSDQQGGALARFDTFSSANSVIDVSHVDFSGGRAVDSGIVSLNAATGKISFWNNVVHFNETENGDVIVVSPGAGKIIDITNNTVTQNVSPQYRAFFATSDGTVRLNNNVIWGNSGSYDVSFTPAVTLDARSNHFGKLPNGIVGAQGSTTGDPLFTNASLSDYRPRPQSPLRNSGLVNPPGGAPSQDFAGIPRSAGGRIDRGAYEFDELMSNGFE